MPGKRMSSRGLSGHVKQGGGQAESMSIRAAVKQGVCQSRGKVKLSALHVVPFAITRSQRVVHCPTQPLCACLINSPAFHIVWAVCTLPGKRSRLVQASTAATRASRGGEGRG